MPGSIKFIVSMSSKAFNCLFLYLLFAIVEDLERYINDNNADIDTIIANIYWDAPIDIPIHIESNRKERLYGSFIAVLNLITDKAPTSPRESANDVLTTAIIEATLIVSITNVLPIDTFDENVFEYFVKRYFKNTPAKKERISIVSASIKDNWAE